MNPFDPPGRDKVHDFPSLVAALKLRIDVYVDERAEGVADNQHMNECGGVQPPETRIRDTLEKYVDRCGQNPGLWQGDFHTGSILGKMALIAKVVAREEELDEVDRAIIVDFINYTGETAGCDYGMYTKDLDGDEWRQGC